MQDVKERMLSLFPGLTEFSDYNSLGEGCSALLSSVKTVHSVSVGCDRIACEGVSLKVSASGPFSGFWFVDILSRTARKPCIHGHIFSKKEIIWEQRPTLNKTH